MKPSSYIIMLLLMTGGCASEMAKRSTYETLENLRMQQCTADLSANCSERESYHDYTRKREEIVK